MTILDGEYFTTKRTELDSWEDERGHVNGAFTKGISKALQDLARDEEVPVASLITEAADLLFQQRGIELYRPSEEDSQQAAFFKLIKYKPKNEVPKARRVMVFNEQRAKERGLLKGSTNS